MKGRGPAARAAALPLDRDGSARFLPWIVALLAYLCAMAAAGSLLLNDAIGNWSRSVTGTLTLQLPPETPPTKIDDVLNALRMMPGVRSARSLEKAETASLLEPWLGRGIAAEALPLPVMVDVRADPRSALDLPGLKARLAALVPGAQLDDHGLWLGHLRDIAGQIQFGIAAALSALLAVTIMAVVFSTNTGLAIHAQIVELLHLLGAQDGYVARQFQSHAFRLGLKGGAVGAILAALSMVAAAQAADSLEFWPGPSRSMVDARLVLLMLAVPVALALVAMLTARITVLRRLARMP